MKRATPKRRPTPRERFIDRHAPWERDRARREFLRDLRAHERELAERAYMAVKQSSSLYQAWTAAYVAILGPPKAQGPQRRGKR